jgi:hypothetical protein
VGLDVFVLVIRCSWFASRFTLAGKARCGGLQKGTPLCGWFLMALPDAEWPLRAMRSAAIRHQARQM